ncbi:LOW QUALITY PROTEIN: protein lin-28 homolog B-like [Colius striatus]|uniref:LOW QUALITY PROTEIN: protein lin-28 homolog B-like n=1 Tax=Colius striatus TaxID=57412 RepID=UPI002B1D9310|nr:LOW QUALITY PROTEIN: protein lin-28 homolog B-like [Colius striatus]
MYSNVGCPGQRAGERLQFNSILCILSPTFLLFPPPLSPHHSQPPIPPPHAFPSSSAGASKGGDEPGKLPEQEEEEESQVLHGTGHCKWFNGRMGFGYISMSNREGSPLESPVDVFVHRSKLYMEGFRSLKKGEPVEFTFKKSSNGLESIRVTGPGGSPCLGSERQPKGKTVQKRKPKGDRCYKGSGLNHHAKECSLPPQPRKRHYCHMVANCPHKTVSQQPASSQGRHEAEPQPSTSAFPREGGGAHGYLSPPHSQKGRLEVSERSGRSLQEASSSKLSASPKEPSRKGPSVQKKRKI